MIGYSNTDCEVAIDLSSPMRHKTGYIRRICAGPASPGSTIWAA
jgi:hypothetical protein